MALVVKDRVKETTTTTGTGALTLGGAVANFVTFSSVLSDGDTTYYAIVDDGNGDFEVGLGTYASAGTTLTRTTVLASSNSGSAVNLQAGTKNVFITYPADKSVYLDAAGDLVGQTIKTFTLSGGTADGTTIGNTIPAAGTFTTANATTVDTTNLEVTNLKAKDGTSAGSIADSTGVVTLASSVLTTTDINGGTIDGATVGGTTAAAGTFTTFTSTGIDDNATSTAITIDSSQEVGIGVTAPQAPFHARKSSGAAAELEVSRFETFLTGGTTGQQILKILENNLPSASGGQYSRFESVFINSVGSTLDAGFEFGGNSAGSYLTIDSSGTVQFQNAIEEKQYSLTGTAIDPSNGTIQYKTLSANTTFTESLSNGEYVTLMIDDGSSYTVTWPTTTWVGGTAPVLETSGYNVIELWHVNGTLYGAFIGAT